MPPLPSVPSVVDLKLTFTTAGSVPASTHFYFSYSGGPPQAADLTSFAADAASEWSTQIAGQTGNNIALTEVSATDMQTNSGAVGIWTGENKGTSPDISLSSGACFNVGAKIARRYRGGKPKVFLPGVPTAYLGTGNELTPGAISDITGAVIAFVGALSAKSFPSFTTTNAVNVSFYSGFTTVVNPTTGRSRNVPKLRSTPVVDVISTWACSPKLGSQRRRLNT